MLVIVCVKVSCTHSQHKLANFSKTLEPYRPTAVGDENLKIVCWNGGLRCFVAKGALISVTIVDNFAFTYLTSKVEHRFIKLIKWNVNPSDLTEKLTVKRFTILHFRISLSIANQFLNQKWGIACFICLVNCQKAHFLP